MHVSADGQIADAKEPEINFDIPDGAFALLIPVPGGEPTVIFEYRSPVMLGRPTTPEQIIPDLIDLTPYNATAFGVSRNHVRITKAETGYIFEDLGSVNGSWLNRLRLIPNKKYPLRNGDEFRLGKLWLHFYCKRKTGEPASDVSPDTDKLA